MHFAIKECQIASKYLAIHDHHIEYSISYLRMYLILIPTM
jgi:hypothetical protein